MKRRDFNKYMAAAVAGMVAGTQIVKAAGLDKGSADSCSGKDGCKGADGCKGKE